MSDHNIDPILAGIGREMADFMKRVHAQREAHKSACSQLFEKHRTALLEKGVSLVICNYSGYGDSGAVDEVLYTQEDTLTEVPVGELPAEMDGDIRNYAESLLPVGFEVNEGGQGTVILDLRNRTYIVNHEENITEVRSESYGGAF